MQAVVIAAFIDRATGKRIKAGEPLPAGMTEDRLRKLARAGCVRIDGAAPAPTPEKPKRKRRAAAPGSAEPQTLFPGGADDAAAAASVAVADSVPVAGGDGGDPGAGAVADAGGRADGDGEGPDDSGQ